MCLQLVLHGHQLTQTGYRAVLAAGATGPNLAARRGQLSKSSAVASGLQRRAVPKKWAI